MPSVPVPTEVAVAFRIVPCRATWIEALVKNVAGSLLRHTEPPQADNKWILFTGAFRQAPHSPRPGAGRATRHSAKKSCHGTAAWRYARKVDALFPPLNDRGLSGDL